MRPLPRPLLFVVLGLSSCSSMRGTWVGICDFADGTYAYAADVTAVIDRGGGNLTGTMTVDFEGEVFTGDLTGLNTGSRLELEGSFIVEQQGYLMTIKAEEAGPDWDGECRFNVPGGGSGYLVGDITLEELR